MKKYLMALCLFVSAVGASAQIEDGDKQLFNHLGAGISVGTDGVGFNLATTITPYVQARVGISYVPAVKVNDIKTELNISGQTVNEINNGIDKLKEIYPAFANLNHINPPKDLTMTAKLNMTNFKVLFDFYPTKTSAWRLTAGFYAGKSQIVEMWTTNCQNELQTITDYNNAVESTKAALPVVGVEIGDYLIKPNGPEARGILKVNGFKPYIGIGSGRAVSNKHRFSFSWDLGAQLWGTPSIYVNDTKLNKEDVGGDGGEIVKVISKISVYPTLSIRLNGRIL